MKVIQVNSVYKKGSTGKIVYDTHIGLLNRGVDSIVCYGRGPLIKEKNVYKTCPELFSYMNNVLSRITGIVYAGCFYSTNKLISIIKKEKPDIVHLQCINGYFVNIYRLITWLKNHKIKTVLTLHADFMFTGGCGSSIDCNQWKNMPGCGYSPCPLYKRETHSIFRDGSKEVFRRMKKAFEGFNDNLIITSVSPWICERGRESIILKGRDHRVVLNGLDPLIFHYKDSNELRLKHSIPDNAKVVFHATPAFSLDKSHLKGGYYINEIAKLLKKDNYIFLVAGPHDENINVSDNIVLLGPVFDQKLLAKYYSFADITMLTSSRETFSMVTVESLSCGTPVVGFKAGGPELIAIPEYSEFVNYADIQALRDATLKIINKKIDKEIISKKACSKYSKDNMVEGYLSIYRELVGETK